MWNDYATQKIEQRRWQELRQERESYRLAKFTTESRPRRRWTPRLVLGWLRWQLTAIHLHLTLPSARPAKIQTGTHANPFR